MEPLQQGIAQLLIGLPILFGNGFVLYILKRYLNTKTRCHMLLMNVAFADLLVGTVLLIQSFINLTDNFKHTAIVCIFKFSSMVLVSFASLFAVLLTAIERYISVCFKGDFFLITNRKSVIAVIASWVYCIVLTVTPIPSGTYRIILVDGNTTGCLPSQEYLVFVPVQYFVILFTMCILYAKMCRLAVTKKRQILISSSLVLNSHLMKFQYELRAAKFMAILLVVFMFCWTPFAVTLICQATKPNIDTTAREVAEITAFLGVINSVINPLLYPLQNRRFRFAFFLMFGRLKKRLTKSKRTTFSTVV